MHTVIARLVFRWVTVFLVVILVGVLTAGLLRTAHATDAPAVAPIGSLPSFDGLAPRLSAR